ncbi:MAG TPA: hypothetical protein VK176_07960 [Phycisphaerales bacterium]|nr:hypothetical protein [Phycisphaerales bacterium]
MYAAHVVRGLCCIIISLTLVCDSAIADSREKLEAWLRSQRELNPFSAFENTVLTFTRKTPPQMSAAALNEMRAQIARFPDHPSHADVQAEEYRQRDGGTIVQCQAFFCSSGNWRICETNTWENDNLRYVDTCLRSDRAWRLIPTQLRIVDPRSGFPENSDYSRLEVEYARTLHCVLNGGIWLWADAGIVSIGLGDGQWTVRIGTDEREVEFTGSWMVREGQTHFLTGTRRITRNPIEEYVGQTETFSGWKWNDQIARPLASQIEVRRSDNRVERVIVLQEIRPLPADEFEQVTRTPQVGAPDAIRGPATYTSVWDHRPDVGRITYPGSPALSERLPDDMTGSWWNSRWAWVVAAVIAVALVVLRMGRRLSFARGAA